MRLRSCTLLLLTVTGIAACSGQQSAAGSITLIEAPHVEGCTYDGKYYSPGAVKRAMMATVNDQGYTEMQETPDGPFLLCVRGATEGYQWTTNHKFNEFAVAEGIGTSTGGQP